MTLRLDPRRGGFSLVELLIVIVIIGVIAAIAIPRFNNAGLQSREASLRANLKTYRSAVELFRNDTGAFPATLNDLAATTAPASGLNADGTTRAITASDYRGPYVLSIEPDPVSGAALTYGTTSPNVGRVTSSASGNDSGGRPYSGY